jgi:predicted nuclease of restriction endonuclease-like (RecB) superfamily
MKRKRAIRGRTLSGAERICGENKSLNTVGTIAGRGKTRTIGRSIATPPQEPAFREVLAMIEAARARAYQALNTELIDLYWRVGQYISRKLESAAWGEAVVDQLARYLAQHHPDLRGFTRASLFRMRQFYEIYRHEQIVAPLVRQLSWSHNLLILGRCKRPEEREFYLRLCARGAGADANWNISCAALFSSAWSSRRQKCHHW